MKSRKKGAKKVVRTQRLKEFTLKFYCFILPLFVALRWHVLSSIYVECSMNSGGYIKQIWAQGCWTDAECDTVQKLALEIFRSGRVSKTCVVTLKLKMSGDRCLWKISVLQFAHSTQFRKDSECLPRSRWPDRSDPWSDEFWPHTCSRCARITWSGKGFERTFVWTMVWNLPDQRPLCSGTVWSEVTLVWDGLIRGSFKRTLVWSEADSSAH